MVDGDEYYKRFEQPQADNKPPEKIGIGFKIKSAVLLIAALLKYIRKK